jgi:hypothetical protein
MISTICEQLESIEGAAQRGGVAINSFADKTAKRRATVGHSFDPPDQARAVTAITASVAAYDVVGTILPIEEIGAIAREHDRCLGLFLQGHIQLRKIMLTSLKEHPGWNVAHRSLNEPEPTSSRGPRDRGSRRQSIHNDLSVLG